MQQLPPPSSDPQTLWYESAAKPFRPRSLDAMYRRAVERVVIVFVAAPVGIGSLLLGWALVNSALRPGLFHGSDLFLLTGILVLAFGSIVLGVAGYHAVSLLK